MLSPAGAYGYRKCPKPEIAFGTRRIHVQLLACRAITASAELLVCTTSLSNRMETRINDVRPETGDVLLDLE